MRIKEKRLELGLTQQQLSDITGVPRRTIQNWESGINKPPEWAENLIMRWMNSDNFTEEKIMKYYVDFGTGAGNEHANSLEEAKKIADNGAAYTQCSIHIYELNDTDIELGEPVASRFWYGVEPDYANFEDGENADIIRFGNIGFFGEWTN